MTTADQAWAGLQTLEDSELVTALRTRMLEINAQPADDRVAELAGVLLAEAEFSDAELRRFTTARYRAWLTMPASDVQTFIASLDDARDVAPVASAMRNTTVDQSAARDLTEAECLRLLDLAPSFERALPQEVRDTRETAARQDRDAARAAEREAAGRPFWKFWQR